MKRLIFSLLLITEFCWAEVSPIEIPFSFPVRHVVPEHGYVGKFTLLNNAFEQNEKIVYNLETVINFENAESIYVEHAIENYYRVSVEYPNGAIRYIVGLVNEKFEVIKSQELVY